MAEEGLESEVVNRLRAEVQAQHLVLRALKAQMRDLKEKQKKVDDLVQLNKAVLQRLACTQKQMLVDATQMHNAMAEQKRKEALLMATVNVLVTDWLSPQQRESLLTKDECYQNKKLACHQRALVESCTKIKLPHP
jgi:asparagine synthetase B (glutamine-hydrolysing)